MASGGPGLFTEGIPRLVLILITLAAGWLVISGVRQLQDILAPLLLTLNLMIVIYPIQARLTAAGLPKPAGAVVSGVLILLLLTVFLAALGWSLFVLVQEVPGYQGRFQQLYAAAVEQLGRIGITESQVLTQLQQISPSNVIGFVQNTFSGLLSALSMLVIIVTVVIVVVMDSVSFAARMRLAKRHDPTFVRSLVEVAHGVRRYWVVSSTFGLIVAVLDVGVLMWLNVPLALVWGLLSFLTNYIPTIGFILGLIPPAVMALLANGPQTALIVIAAYSVINFVIQSIIQPKISGQAIGVTPTVALLSLLFWAWVLGPLGALLSLPATLVVKAVFIDADPQVRWFNVFVASDPRTAELHPDVEMR